MALEMTLDANVPVFLSDETLRHPRLVPYTLCDVTRNPARTAAESYDLRPAIPCD